jgi:small subunit ribosomal protein S6e
MQLVIGQNDGTAASIDLTDEQTNPLLNLQIGDEFDGSIIGLDGYTFKITGGSDQDGFPMRQQLQGTGRKQILAEGGAGVNDLEKGERQRKTLRGNTVSDDIAQLNCSVVEEGSASIDKILEEEEEENTEPEPAKGGE